MEAISVLLTVRGGNRTQGASNAGIDIFIVEIRDNINSGCSIRRRFETTQDSNYSAAICTWCVSATNRSY